MEIMYTNRFPLELDSTGLKVPVGKVFYLTSVSLHCDKVSLRLDVTIQSYTNIDVTVAQFEMLFSKVKEGLEEFVLIGSRI